MRFAVSAFDRIANALTGCWVLRFPGWALYRYAFALAGVAAEVTVLRADRIDTVMVATDARWTALRVIVQRIAERALAGFRIDRMVFAGENAVMLAADLVARAAKRLADACLALLAVTTGMPTRPAVVVVGLGIYTRVVAQRLRDEALAFSPVTVDVWTARMTTAATVVRISVRIDAGSVAQLLIVRTRTLPGNTFLSVLTGMAAGSAVVRIGLQIGTAAKATASLTSEATSGAALALAGLQRKPRPATRNAGHRLEAPISVSTKRVVTVLLTLTEGIPRFVLALRSIADERRCRLGY